MAELTDDQQERLDRLQATLCQGDLVHLTPLATVGSPASTIHESVELAEPFAEYGLATIEWRAASGLWAIVTQTCDVRRAPDVEPFLHLALVLDVSEEEWTTAEGGRSSTRRFAYPSPIEDIERPVLDVRVLQSVEKHALGDERLRPLTDVGLTPPMRARLAQWLSRRFARHAFPDWLEEAVLRRLRQEVQRRQRAPGTPAGALVLTREAILVGYGEGAGVEISIVVRPHRVLGDAVLKDEVATQSAAEQLMRPVVAAGTKAGCTVTWEVASPNAIPWSEVLYRLHPLDVDLP